MYLHIKEMELLIKIFFGNDLQSIKPIYGNFATYFTMIGAIIFWVFLLNTCNTGNKNNV